MVWREGGPNAEPAWDALLVDGWELSDKKLEQLGIGHGDVLVVQEHPNRLPPGLPIVVEWLRLQQSHL